MELLVRGATEFGEPGVFVAFEERPEELTRNVASLGWDVQALVGKENSNTARILQGLGLSPA